MTESSSNSAHFDKVLEEFIARHRRGEQPSVSEFRRRYPALAQQIDEVFPALVLIEEFGSVHDPARQAPGSLSAPRDLPQQLGEYRILREIGRGGMGIVYEAVQESLGRHVALKVLPVHPLSSPSYLDRFHREAQVAANLHHTNIVSVFGTGEQDGIHYFAMQFIQGQSLDVVLRELKRYWEQKEPLSQESPPAIEVALASGIAQSLLRTAPQPESIPPSDRPAVSVTRCAPSDPGSTCSTTRHSELLSRTKSVFFHSVAGIGIQVADALAYAHRQGTLHRDIKPSNVLLDAHGAVWVTDFGLAKALANPAGERGDADLTGPGDILGTIRYMAPERFRGMADERSDIYALGATLYELLTLRAPFVDEDRHRLIERVLHEPPIPPRKLDRSLPRDLETIVLKAMAKEAVHRYPSADALAGDLRRFLSDRPIEARRTSTVERLWRWSRRNPALALLTGAVVVLLGAVAIGSALSSLWLREKHRDAMAAGRDAVDKLWHSYLHQARAGRYSGRSGQRMRGLEVLQQAAAIRSSLELRNEAIACLALVDLQESGEWVDVPTGATALAFDAELQRCARADPEGRISVRRVATDQETRPLPSDGFRVHSLRFSPDGRFLAVGDYRFVGDEFGGCVVWDVEQGQVVVRLRVPPGLFCFTPDSRYLVASDFQSVIGVHDLLAMEQARTARGPLARSLAVSPNGTRLAIVTPRSIVLWDLVKGQSVNELFESGLTGGEPAWHGRGAILAVPHMDGVLIWQTDTAQPPEFLKGRSLPISQCAFHPNGKLLASKARDGSVSLWDVATARELVVAPDAHLDSRLQFNRDGSRLAARWERGKAGLWDVTLAHECMTLAPRCRIGRELTCGVAFGMRDSLLISTSEEGFRIWDLEAGGEPEFERHHRVYSARVNAMTNELITSGVAGLWRFPLHRDAQGALRRGAGERVPVPGMLTRSALSGDGQALLVIQPAEKRALVAPARESAAAPRALHQENIWDVALTSDGRWAATANAHEIKVWRVKNGELMRTLPTDGFANLAFSPDGAWLAAGAAAHYQLWHTDSWQRCWQLERQGAMTAPGALAFSPDGKLLALELAAARVQLVDPATGHGQHAALEHYDARPVHALAFSVDGAQLAVGCNGHVVQLWNIRRIRDHLAKLGLDWQ